MHVITQDGILWRTLPCPTMPRNGSGEISRFKAYGTRRAP